MPELPPNCPRLPRLRVARGPKRPDYLGNRDLDRVAMMLTALVGEVSALVERVDTHELLAADGLVATAAAIDAHRLSPADEARRAALREAMLRRIYRVLFEELEQAAAPEQAP